MRLFILLLPLLTACQAQSERQQSSVHLLPAAASPSITVVEALPFEVTPLHVGQYLRIALEDNPSTGYQWEPVLPLPAQLRLVDDDLLPPAPSIPQDEQRVGVPQPFWLYVRAQAPGTADIVLQWRRPWETGQPPARTVRYQVTVR